MQAEARKADAEKQKGTCDYFCALLNFTTAPCINFDCACKLVLRSSLLLAYQKTRVENNYCLILNVADLSATGPPIGL